MALALTGLGRVFVNSAGRQGGNRYKYHSCMKIDGVDKSLGDVTPIYCPKPDAYDEFIEVATIKGADSRATSTLTGYLPIDAKGVLEDIYNQKCGFDLQVHYGQCNRPDEFNQFLSALILKDVKLTSYAMSTLTARTPDERAAIDETAAISIGDFYRVYATTEAIVKPTQLTGNVFTFGIANASVKSCGDGCTERDDGCQVWIGGYIAANYVVHFLVTEDNGATWRLTPANMTWLHNKSEHLANIHIAGGYVYTQIVQGNVSLLYRTSISSILNNSADSTLLYTSQPNSYYHQITSSDNYIWFAGVWQGSVMAVTYLNTSTLEIKHFTKVDSDYLIRSVYAYSDDSVLVMGDNGGGFYSTINGIFTKVTTKPTTASVQTVKMFGPSKWLVGTTDGIYYTNNAGVTWTKVLTTSGSIKFAFYDEITGYAVTANGTYRTLDSGNSWLKIGSNVTTHVQLAAVCPSNPNLYWAAIGLAGSSSFLTGSS